MANHKHCQAHLDYARERSRSIRKAKSASGKCVWNGCNGMAIPDRTYCQSHLAHSSSQRRAKRRKNIELGLCTACSLPVDHGSSNRKCRKCIEAFLIKRRTPERRYSANRWEAKRRGKTWSLSKDDYLRLVKETCHYCGLPNKVAYGVGLDRLDNTRGYERSNVVSCCDICNTVRNDIFSYEEMQQLGPIIRKLLDARLLASPETVT
jgi:hypothetical protein